MEKIKIGILGTGTRGRDIANDFLRLGCDIVALCEKRREELEKASAIFGEGAKLFEDFEDFINNGGMDAVVVSNNFQDHAPYAIRCLEKNIHVYSECISNGTMAEGVELVKAFEKSKAIYMLGENYPQSKFNREIQRVCKNGTLGKLVFAECEYNHPTSPYDINFAKQFNYSVNHWRNYAPSTYYITHSLGPIMAATGATPKRVNAYSIFAPIDEKFPTAKQNGDIASIMMTQNDDGSVFRLTGCSAFGAHHKYSRVCGNKGQIENSRDSANKIILRYNAWEIPEGLNEINVYDAQWCDDVDVELASKSGHGGADYLTCKMFLDCIRENKQPDMPFDLHSAVAMSSVAILAHRSALEGCVPYDIPDFHQEEWCEKYKDDRLSPFFGNDGSAPTLPCCSKVDHKPTESQIKAYKEALEENK